MTYPWNRANEISKFIGRNFYKTSEHTQSVVKTFKKPCKNICLD